MRTTRTPGLRLALIAVTCVIATGTVQGQVADEANAGIQFNFTPPGARSLAMGGAFVGLADDATAAYTNPAGLTTLAAPELGLEIRYTRYSHVFTDGGRNGGTPTGTGVDTVDHLVFGESDTSLFTPSFLSYAFAGEGWAFSLYRHQVVDFEAAFQTQGAFYVNSQGLNRLFPVKTNLDLEVANYGFSVAIDVTDSFSIGFGGSYYDFEIDGTTSRYDFFGGGGSGAGEFFGPPLYTDANIFSQQYQTGSDRDVSFNVGLLWKATDMVWLGAVYRHGPRFTFNYGGVCGPSDPDFCNQGYGGTDEFISPAIFKVPNTYGIGAAFKPTDALTLTLDWDRIEYSGLTEYTTGIPTLSSQFQYFTVEDGDEFHLGVEYVLIAMDSPVALRAGTWLDPAHQVGYTGDWVGLQTLWAPAADASDEWHFSAGLGVSFAAKFQVDFAFDFSERVDTLSLSGVYRF